MVLEQTRGKRAGFRGLYSCGAPKKNPDVVAVVHTTKANNPGLKAKAERRGGTLPKPPDQGREGRLGPQRGCLPAVRLLSLIPWLESTSNTR